MYCVEMWQPDLRRWTRSAPLSYEQAVRLYVFATMLFDHSIKLVRIEKPCAPEPNHYN
jgi:hypothetical protein